MKVGIVRDAIYLEHVAELPSGEARAIEGHLWEARGNGPGRACLRACKGR